MADSILNKFIIAGIIVIVAGLFGWLIQVAMPFIFQNGTDNESRATYISTTMQTMHNNLPLIFLGLGVLAAVVYLLIAITNTAKK